MTSATQHAPLARSTDSLSDLLARTARAHPHRTALSDPVRTLDYRTLDAVADRVAGRLDALDVGPGDRVALLGPRDARMVALLHGVLRSGAAAVLVDPEWSAADLARRLDAVRVCRVLSTESALSGPGPTEWVDLDGDAGAAVEVRRPGAVRPVDTDLAYLSFTSGSSGEPKAVAVTHANAVHYARALAGRLGRTDATADVPRIAHVTTLAADLGHTAWLWALAVGGSVHVVSDREARDPQAFWAALRTAGVTALKTTPSHLTALLDGRPAASRPLHTVLLGGEPLPRPLAAAVLESGVAARVVNHYGPTETTVGAACFVADRAGRLPPDEPTVPIGTGIGEVVLRVLDEQGRPVADGTVGELFIGGRGVSAGYFDRPAETARSFPRPAAGAGGPAYRTGDLCRRRADGALVFVGRVDRQVKVRGFRVDLAEVERAVDAFPGVSGGAVLVRDTPLGKQLVAAVRVVDRTGETVRRLGAHLRDRLPAHAVPQPILPFPELPVGANGKLDRRRLDALVAEAIEARAQDGSAGPLAPADHPRRTALAGTLAAFWASALGLTRVGVHTEVLALGGDSLLAMRTIAFLRRSGHHVGYEDFYRHPTAARLAAAASTARPTVPAPRADDRGPHLAPAQRWLFGQRLDDLRHWNQSVVLRCRKDVDPGALGAAVAAVLTRHPALRRPLTADGYGPPRPVAETDALSFSRLPADPGAVADTVTGLCTALHRSMDPEAGRLLRVHLFRGAGGTDDRLALVAHHLVVDGLSWRVLLDDLAHGYRAAAGGRPVDLPPTPDFYRWAASAPPAPEAAEPEPAAASQPGTLVWTLDQPGTARLVARCGAGPGLEALLLAAFADALLAEDDRPRLAVEVETHGRDAAGGADAQVDTVGWFTAVKEVVLDASAAGPGGPPGDVRVREVGERLRRAPVRPMDRAGARPRTGFNFLGTFRLPHEPALDWTVADEPAGLARCPGGDPLYALRLTARIVEDRLVTDLVHGVPMVPRETARRVVGRFARAVAEAAGARAAAPVPVPLSTSGQLLHTGRQRPRSAAPGRLVVDEPARVLLTGATGYLGGHLCTALLERGAHVVCLVRAEHEAAAARRLAAAHPRVEAVAGDVDREGLGLSPAGLIRARTARIVVHAAADVRLVAPPTALARTNHHAVRRLLTWVDAHAPEARFHHVSTLAVAGTLPGDGPARRFGEADLHLGQDFGTPYERTKFAAEETVRAWAATGRPYWVHRSGHIAAHSRSGAFQANPGDNRIYQLLRGYLLAGAAPRRPSTAFAFSHVDTVAAGIAAIALDPCAAPGAYHVETPYDTPHDEVVGWLAAHGHRVRLTDDDAFAAALDRVGRSHPEAAGVAAAWSLQGERRIAVDRSYTTAVLDRLGVRFAAPTAQWFGAALDWAAGTGFLPPVDVPGRPH
ncbi:amino acid adenylation domain-containing protein [Streptomyces sp. LE64]|uniref:amino acid adenylation domain-containing protein n=1 Tax=Streptomyces sp. LE64 TaxID=3448653 RepID=UPI004041AA64